MQPERRSNGYRDYGEQDVRRLRFVQRARNLGFTIEDCRSLLHLWDKEDRASADVKGIAMLHLNEVDHKIHELELLRACLRKVINACPGDAEPECPILDKLAVD